MSNVISDAFGPMPEISRINKRRTSRRTVPTTLDDLPAPDTVRWTKYRKLAVVDAVKAGLLTLEEASERYNLSAEELSSWRGRADRHGADGLRTTRLQDYRRKERGAVFSEAGRDYGSAPAGSPPLPAA